MVDKACTSIIITGKATPDGRPLMWKHRDTGAPYNHISYLTKVAIVSGLVNSDDPEEPCGPEAMRRASLS
mgnify:CR=1 FL=1